jgi:hypothetical protein
MIVGMPVCRRMNFAELLATETAAYHPMQIASEELSPTARGIFSGCGPGDCRPDEHRQM